MCANDGFFLLREHINITKDKIECLLGDKKDVALEANTEVKRDTPAGTYIVNV